MFSGYSRDPFVRPAFFFIRRCALQRPRSDTRNITKETLNVRSFIKIAAAFAVAAATLTAQAQLAPQKPVTIVVQIGRAHV